MIGDNIAVKLSTGEPPASNYLDPNLIADLVHQVDGTIVENNTAYGGQRSSTAMHYQVAKDHGFTDIADFVVLDEDGSVSLPVKGGTRLTENLVGAHFPEYDGYLAKLLRYIVHTLEIFMWEQDYCLNPDEDDFFTDILPEEGIYIDDLEEKEEALPAEPEGRPSWQVHIEYSNHTVQDICSYEDYLPDRPEELYLSFMEYFEPDEDSFEFT